MSQKKTLKREFRFRFDSSEPIPVSLTDAEIHDVRTEFVWFFNGQNNARTLVEQKSERYLDVLYSKYETEIGKMREHYGLDEILPETDYAQGWFADWKKMELFSKTQFREKIRTSEDFSLVWADLGITDSLEFRKWGLSVKFDANDNASIGNPGKDQLALLIDSIVLNPESGLHFVTFYNPSNAGDRSEPVDMLSSRFACDPMSYEERIRWFFENHWETGMEYHILLQDMRDKDLDKVKFHDGFVSIPKYRISLFSDYGRIETEKRLDQLVLFNAMFLKTIALFVNMEPSMVSIFTLNGFKKKLNTKKETVSIMVNAEMPKGLNIQNENFRISRSAPGADKIKL